MLWTMGGEEIIRIGAFTLAEGEAGWAIGFGIVAAGFVIMPVARWHFRQWRIRRAFARGDRDHAEYLMAEREDGPAPLSLLWAILALVGLLGLMIFQENFAVELEQMMGEGWGFLAVMLTMGFVFTCTWIWEQVRRNALSPEELAALEEEDEHQRWMRSIDGDSMPGLFAALALGAGILAAIYFLIRAITPG